MFYYKKLMYDLNSYLGKMASSLVTDQKLNNAKYGKPSKRKKRIKEVSSHANFHGINFKLSEDDLP